MTTKNKKRTQAENDRAMIDHWAGWSDEDGQIAAPTMGAITTLAREVIRLRGEIELSRKADALGARLDALEGTSGQSTTTDKGDA
ncbi:MAG: hypothetical protein QOD72_1171 [Acidimicrobiaceae bacterium]|jgi:hypothetical protein|nr:hypothetical protein [Acidimicrobiaceae bacterium]